MVFVQANERLPIDEGCYHRLRDTENLISKLLETILMVSVQANERLSIDEGRYHRLRDTENLISKLLLIK